MASRSRPGPTSSSSRAPRRPGPPGDGAGRRRPDVGRVVALDRRPSSRRSRGWSRTRSIWRPRTSSRSSRARPSSCTWRSAPARGARRPRSGDGALARRVLDAASAVGAAARRAALERARLRRLGQQPGAAHRGRAAAPQPGLARVASEKAELERPAAEWRDAHPGGHGRGAPPDRHRVGRRATAGWPERSPVRARARRRRRPARRSSSTSTTSPPPSTWRRRGAARRPRNVAPDGWISGDTVRALAGGAPRAAAGAAGARGWPPGGGAGGSRPRRRTCCRGRCTRGWSPTTGSRPTAGSRPAPTRRPTSPATGAGPWATLAPAAARSWPSAPPVAARRRRRRRRRRCVAPLASRRLAAATAAALHGRLDRLSATAVLDGDVGLVVAPSAPVADDHHLAGLVDRAARPPGRSSTGLRRRRPRDHVAALSPARSAGLPAITRGLDPTADRSRRSSVAEVGALDAEPDVGRPCRRR